MLTAIKFGITLLKRQGGFLEAQEVDLLRARNLEISGNQLRACSRKQEASAYLRSGELTAFFVGVEDQLNWWAYASQQSSQPCSRYDYYRTSG